MNRNENILINEIKEEICNECGRSVKFRSGFFVNRVIDLNPVEERKNMNKPFPEGTFICSECDEKIHN